MKSVSKKAGAVQTPDGDAFAYEWPKTEEDLDAHLGQSLLVRTGPWAWRVAVDFTDPADRIPLLRGAGPAKATVSGEPSELLLWLWGRRPDSAVSLHGDPQALASMRELLAYGTQ